jgi:hypothetical protein
VLIQQQVEVTEFWLWSMQGGLRNLYDSIKAFSETDFHEDLKKFDVPRWSCMGKTTKSCRSIPPTPSRSLPCLPALL